MFRGGDPACTAQVAADVGLVVGRCGCAGYTTEAAAFGEPTPIVDVTELRLRGPADLPPANGPVLAPARDMFDEGRRLRGLSALGDAPWRPAS